MSAPAKKTSKARVAPTHPSFKDMIAATIKALGEKNGASRHKIRAHIASHYKVTDSSMKGNLNKSLRKLVESGYLSHPKRAPGCFKLSEQVKEKKAAKPKAKKSATAAQKKTVVKKPKSTAAKKAVTKKPKAKKAVVTGAKKATVKKSAKKPAKKVAKKPAAKKSPKKSATKKTVKKAASKKK